MTDEEVIERLAAGPETFDRLLTQAPEHLLSRPNEDEWSPLEIWDHVVASDAILRPRVFHVLVRDDPPLPGFDERTWADIARRAHLDLATQLATFEGARRELVRVLRSLAPGDWDRSGVHDEKGRQTLRDIITYLADHEQAHIAQMTTTIHPARRDKAPRTP